jgi:hypothetical protein
LFSAAAREAESTGRITSQKKKEEDSARARQVTSFVVRTQSRRLFFFLNKKFCGENRQEGENDSLYLEKSPILYYDIEGKRTKKGPKDQNQSICPFSK